MGSKSEEAGGDGDDLEGSGEHDATQTVELNASCSPRVIRSCRRDIKWWPQTTGQ
ncbi:hypothetical protein FA13DRAFT_1727365 [Coprinellus micaceus]|uniref:Uncharacterized protein n=1 Tax=Coprinellus micaceus TaxID=71717 RepID=A0A4Y7TSQ2_COPMI|nr:hypothetical protein FA13DRAFT_1727365 [Coprinellus micaceus]